MSKATHFLRAIIPNDDLACIAHVRNFPAKGRPKKPWTQKFFTKEQLANGVVSEHIDLLNEHEDTDVYFGVSAYNRPDRHAKNVSSVQCLLLDIDLKGDRPHFQTKADAVLGVHKLWKEVQCLPKPWIVDSGYGLHAYFVFNKPVPVEDWQPMAAAFAKVAEDVDPRLLADPKPTKDIARVMRVPYTYNAKTERRAFASVKGEGETGDPEQIRAGLASEARNRGVFTKVSAAVTSAPLSIGKPPAHATAQGEAGLGGGLSANKFENLNPIPILKSCAQMKRMAAVAGNVPEPEWVLMLRVLNTCQQADKLALKFSSGHPSFKPSETQRKMRHIRTNFESSTVSCDEFREQCGDHICRGCKFRHSVWTPSQIPDKEKAKEKAKVEDKQADESLAEAAKAKAGETIQQPGKYKQVLNPDTGERFTTLPVYKGKDEGTEDEPLIAAHMELLGGTAEIETDEKGIDRRVGLMVHLKVRVWDEELRIAVPGKTLTSQVLDTATGPLRNVGVAFMYSRPNEQQAVREYLSWLSRAAAAKPLPYFDSKGWAKGALTVGARRYLPTGKVIDGVTYQEHTEGRSRSIEAFCSGRGTGNYRKWKQAMSVYDGEYPHAHLVLLSGLANILLPLMPDMQGGILLALTGRSGAGKTTMMKFMNSFIGNPDEGVVQGNSTTNALLDMLRQSSVFMLPVDDVVAMSAENLTHLLGSVTSGKARRRMEQNAAGEWASTTGTSLNSSLLLTSNFSAAEAFSRGGRKGDRMQLEAAQTRQIEVSSADCVVSGVPLERWNMAGEAIAENHGFALEKFAKHIVMHREVVRQRLTDNRKTLTKLLVAKLGNNAAGQYRFWVRWLATVVTTAEVCRQLNIVNWSVKNMVAAGLELVTGQTEAVEDTENNDMETLWDILTNDENGRININLSEFIVKDDPDWPNWDSTHPSAKRIRGQRKEWADAGSTGIFANITDRVINAPRWRIVATEVWENGKPKHLERSVEIPMRVIKHLVESSDKLSSDYWESVANSLVQSGAIIRGVKESQPHRACRKRPAAIYLKATKGDAGPPNKGIEITFPPIDLT